MAFPLGHARGCDDCTQPNPIAVVAHNLQPQNSRPTPLGYPPIATSTTTGVRGGWGVPVGGFKSAW